VVVFSIVFFLNQVLEPYGLQILGRLFAIIGFVGLIAQPVIGTVKFFRTPGRASKMKRANVLTSLTVAAAIIGLVCFVPLPYHVNCAVRIQPADAFAVRTMVPGQLVAINRRPGEFVNAGDPIFQLRNLRLEQERIKYEGDLKSARLNRQQAELDAVRETSNTSSLSLTEVAESAANQLYTQSVERLKQLDVTSKVSGVVIEPKLKETPKELIAAGQLPSWSGSPFEEKNADAYFADGELLCYIGDLDRMEAVIIIDQSDVWLVEDEGKRDDAKTSGENGSPNLESIDFSNVQVDIMLDAAQLKTLTGTIVEISNINLKETSASMASQTGGSLDTTMDSSGRLTPISTSFEARVQLQDSDVKLRAGYRGQAKIHLQWRSLGWRIWRYAVKTFKFDF
jgi:putative peptide zinc metalloprotease protein